jgi:hypothetical protein
MDIVLAPVSGQDVEEAVVAAASECGLFVASMTTLATLPGSYHWHLRRHQESGTLEVTWIPAKRDLWVSYRANRVGGWVAHVAPEFAASMGRRLRGS